MSGWRPKISRGGVKRLAKPVYCGWCDQPIRKGDEWSVTLWTQKGQGCTTRRHATCDVNHPPLDREVVEHMHNQLRKDGLLQ